MRAILAGSLVALLATSSAVKANDNTPSMSQAPSTSAPSFDAAEEYRRGIDALKVNKFDDAKKSFDKVLSVAPLLADAIKRIHFNESVSKLFE